jgi:hypothetical protein
MAPNRAILTRTIRGAAEATAVFLVLSTSAYGWGAGGGGAPPPKPGEDQKKKGVFLKGTVSTNGNQPPQYNGPPSQQPTPGPYDYPPPQMIPTTQTIPGETSVIGSPPPTRVRTATYSARGYVNMPTGKQYSWSLSMKSGPDGRYPPGTYNYPNVPLMFQKKVAAYANMTVTVSGNAMNVQMNTPVQYQWNYRL